MEHISVHDHCLNCQCPMQPGDKFCSNCGQKQAGPHDHSVWHLILDAVGDFFHMDSKFFATVLPMTIQPGKLTLEFLTGRKTRYFHPFKLFLFLSFLYFLTAGILNHRKTGDSQDLDTPAAVGQDLAATHAARGSYNLNLDKAYAQGISMPDDSLRKMVRKYGLTRFVNIKYPAAGLFEKYMIKKVIKNRLERKNDLDDSMGKIIPKLVFVLIPFFALLLWLIYRRQQVPYFNHIVFTLHFLSFFFLLFWFKELLGLITWVFNPVIVLVLLVYLYFAIKKVYGQEFLVTAGKYVLFLLGSLVALLIFIIVAASISFMMI